MDVTLQHLLCTMSRAKLPRCAALFALSMMARKTSLLAWHSLQH